MHLSYSHFDSDELAVAFIFFACNTNLFKKKRLHVNSTKGK